MLYKVSASYNRRNWDGIRQYLCKIMAKIFSWKNIIQKSHATVLLSRVSVPLLICWIQSLETQFISYFGGVIFPCFSEISTVKHFFVIFESYKNVGFLTAN